MAETNTYDIVEALYEIMDLGADDPSPTTYTPADFADEDGNLRDELPDE